ncbi:transketolase family protein [Ornithinimicrobium sufpigmenti]|uniref:transketolase family protein n=1 Tax=Ornithinimicrobium sufpigmenti TaxID=2508882 RepID=UPI001EDFB83A|nr:MULTISPECIES: transketolase [unclassified Ornithinimicrobium]
MSASEQTFTSGRDQSLSRPVAEQVGWTDADVRAVDTVRVLAMDAVENVGSGHPGTAMSLAPLAYLLYQNVMVHDPSEPHWLGRDRFVLSAGHSSLTQYVQLYLHGYGLELSDLQALRTWGSATPGHPEVHHTTGVEITTGPLGSGLASAVGMAMAQRRQRGLLDPDAAPGESPFDHHIWVIASDGDIMEGVSSEASSLAGHQELSNLTVVYDQNYISIEDDTDISFSEDVAKRYEAYGWHVETVDWRGSAGSTGGSAEEGVDQREGDYVEDVDALYAALQASRERTDKPTLVLLRTIIAWPAPEAQDTGASHGSALGAEEVAATKKLLGFDPEQSFPKEPEVLEHVRAVIDRGQQARSAWQERYDAWRQSNPEGAALLDRLQDKTLPEGLADAIPTFDADEKGMATRKASGEVLSALAPVMPELWGGSADLAGSNNTTMKGETSFVPSGKATKMFPGHEYGRTLHFGIREHAMGMILNGIALEGLTRPYGGTFLVFSDYMRPAVRLASIQQAPVIYVWTHDSIGLGEDGPTHQPIEHLAALRAIPGLDVVRPADANETAVAWRTILQTVDHPSALALTRQNVPTFDRGEGGMASAEGVARGAYVLAEAEGGTPEVILIGTGSEVQLAVAARETLQAQGVPTRVVSMPCREWFDEQDTAYREEVLPAAVRARVSVEAGISLGWRELVGDAGRSVSIEHFGASANYERLYQEFGITAEAVVDAARESLQAAQGDPAPGQGLPREPQGEDSTLGDAGEGGTRSTDETQR